MHRAASLLSCAAAGSVVLGTEAMAPTLDARGRLTVRETEVAELVGEGLSNVQIAEKLFISRRTVESHLEHIRWKLGLRTRHELMALVLQSRAS